MANSSLSDALTQIAPICQSLSELSARVAGNDSWPVESMRICRDGGVFKWFVPQEYGGWGWDESQILAGYLGLSQSCLTTAFILTQWHAACRRILSSNNRDLVERLAPQLADGRCFATVGISQLTTSHQHTAPPLLASSTLGGYELNGFSPWVTGAVAADLLVLGAMTDNGQQVLLAIPTKDARITRHPGMKLLALTASCTDRVDLKSVDVDLQNVIAGPCESVLSPAAGQNAGAGGLHTSILAIGHSMAATAYLRQQSLDRGSLRPVADKLSADVEVLRLAVEQMTLGGEVMSPAQLRRRANSLVLRTTQAALQAAKGAGFIEGHPAGRWAREALFFLVWSCPQAVVDANLCDLAGLESAL